MYIKFFQIWDYKSKIQSDRAKICDSVLYVLHRIESVAHNGQK